MTVFELILIVGSLLSATGSFIWMAVRGGSAKKTNAIDDLNKAADDDVEHIFNDTFREELRNRGRLHFEKIISENAMFLQQDLRLTTSQLNEYMKTEITKTLQDQFEKYEQSITDAKQMAIEALKKTNEVIDEQRSHLSEQLDAEVQKEKERLISQFEANLADVVNHYIISAIGNQIDLSDQLEYILNDLELNREAILEDIKHGA